MNKKITKSLLSVSGIILLSKVLGLVKQMVTANAYGATVDTDIISLSEGLITNVDFLLVQALSTAFIPTYISAEKSVSEKSKFVSNTIKVFFLITLLVSVAIFATSPLLSKILAPLYSDELSNKLSLYLRIFAPVLILVVEMAVFNSLLKSNEKFIPGELIGFNQSVILITLIFVIGSKLGPDTLVLGFYLYAIVNLLFLMFNAKGLWRIEKGNPFKDPNIKKLLVMMGPLILGYSMIFVNQQVDKIIVSGLGEGTITAMGYASVLSNFIATFISSICGVLFTYITQRIVSEDEKGAANLTIDSVWNMSTLLLPISIITIMNSHDIVTVVFGRGKFDATAVDNCSYALIGYAFMFIPFIVREMLSRFQYAYGDSKKPMINSTISIVVNIVLSIILSKFIGVLGVTIATSISVAVCAALNYMSSKSKNKQLKLMVDKISMIKLVSGALLCVIISVIGKYVLGEMNNLLRFLIITIISLGIYFVINKDSLTPIINRFKKSPSKQ